ncbi:unnamed protein product [marine sediment metagenome]|uniref:Uncharacterized protein n=1 Tax=marine sediment metagenome TaxID=412755 RepID=X0VLN7_9ZZZZ
MIKLKKMHDEDFNPITIVEIPIFEELLQDCYMYNAIDAPSELKSMLLEDFAKTIDDLVLSHEKCSEIKKEEIKSKLDKVKISNGNNKKS